jgi:tetratricopeptide (TPR) repeat protein
MADGGLDRAWAALHPALERFPRSQIIAYNLACYAAQLDRLDEAWLLFQRALAVAEKPCEVLCLALTDSDLKPLWPRIRAVEKP